MKKILALILVLCMAISVMSGAMALNYSGNLGNPATFETMTEARANAPDALGAITGTKYAAHPVMDAFPGDTTYVYRSADMYGRNAAIRLNTNIVVYSDQVFASKDDALAYITGLGLVDIIDQARGSVILVTPADGVAFGAADQKNYYALQTAMFALNPRATINGESVTLVDAAYYGGFGFYYVIGIDGGATFLNNYIAGTLDYVSRIAGMLLINGSMERVSKVASYVPVYLANASEATIAKYCEVNGTDAVENDADSTLYYNQAYPVRQVVVDKSGADAKALVNKAYYELFVNCVRGQELQPGVNSASTPYQGYTNDCAPYSLHQRNALINGVTADGIYEITHVGNELAEYALPNGEYLETWYEYLPEEALNNTAPAGSIPLLLSIHGGGDDPRQYVDGQGWLVVAGEERIAIVAPDFASMSVFSADGKAALNKGFPALIRYMLDKYPALDASRVYVNGYSMGSLGTTQAMYGDPGLFAAAYPQAGIMSAEPTEEQFARFADVNLPICISTSEYDLSMNVNATTHDILPSFYNLISLFLQVNEMEALPETPAFETYPVTGFTADITGNYVMNGEYTNHYWYFLDDAGIPMVGFQYIEDIVHCLYPEYAGMVWDFFEHYSRDLNTGAVIYDAFGR